MDHRAPMEELEKVPTDLKGSATLYVEQQYELTSTPRAHVSSFICSRKWPSRPLLGTEALGLANFICPSIGNKISMEGVAETKFGAKRKGWNIQRLPHPGSIP